MQRSASANSCPDEANGRWWKVIRAFSRQFEPIHIGIGIFGNVTFVVGSVFFLYESLRTPGTWLFIVGSLGMLVGSIGQAIVRAESRKLERHVRRERAESGRSRPE